MKSIIIMWAVCASLLSAGDLQEQLTLQLDAGKLTFSHLEAALIAEGVTEPAALAGFVAQYEALVTSLKLNDKQAKGKDKKKAKILHKSIFSALKLEGEIGDGLLAMLQDKAHTPVSATYLLADLAQREGMAPATWAALKDQLEPAYVGTGASVEEAMAAMLTLGAYYVDETATLNAMLMLRLATLIAPDSKYAPNQLDIHFYNRGLTYFNENKLEAAAQLALGACTRYPDQELFSPLTFNIAVKMVNGELADEGKVTYYSRALLPFMGPHGADFGLVLDSRQYNLAAQLYNDKKYESAMVELERVKNPPDQENFNRVLSSTYALLVEQYLEAGNAEKAEVVKSKLAALDPERAKLLTLRLSQLTLKNMVESGDMDRALEQAAQNLSTDMDRQNYKSVLVKYSQGLRTGGHFEKALALLDKVPAGAKTGDTLNNLRFNTYSDWLDTVPEDDFLGQIPIYKQLMADSQLTMTAENKSIMLENYAIALQAEVNKLIEDRQFKEASVKSKAALKIAPSHAGLQEQAKLVKTIMRRISE